MIHLCVDRGNTYTKLAVFDADEIVFDDILQHADEYNYIQKIIQNYAIDNAIVSSVVKEKDELNTLLQSVANKYIYLDAHTPLPITNAYKTPETLGKDRLAGVIGAFALQPNTDILVIDIGTAITYDFIDSNAVYHGGNIAPGVDLRINALHSLTQNLPLVEFIEPQEFLGKDTVSAIQSGVFNGIAFELNGYIEHLLLNYPKLSVFLTGGYAVYFENQLKSSIFAVKNLVLIGLNRILHYNV